MAFSSVVSLTMFHRRGMLEHRSRLQAEDHLHYLCKETSHQVCLFEEPNSELSSRHRRVLPLNDAEADRSGNAKAGTIIDTEIAHPVFDDYYLLSQAGLLGTSRPCHYTILLDENNFGTDVIQLMTYQLAYLSPRSTRSLSIAAPAKSVSFPCNDTVLLADQLGAIASLTWSAKELDNTSI